MKIQDNRHLKNDEIVEIGDMILTENGKYYFFALDDVNEYPVLQIDASTFEVVNGFYKNMLDEFTVGYKLDEGDIKEIFKNKNLIIDIRN